MDNERFTLEGVTYYQQYRKCGKSSCTVCNGGKGHGPYWYCRDLETKKRRYIGKELPLSVLRARQAHDRALSQMLSLRQTALAQYSALSALMRNEKLSDDQKAIIEAIGLGDCLVFRTGQSVTQDLEALPLDQRLKRLGYTQLPGVE